MTTNDPYTAAFREEASELLADLEGALLELEENPGDAELVARAFRDLHTLKGSGSTFGFDDLAAFAHEVETVFDRVRNGVRQVTARLIGLSLDAKDLIRSMLQGDCAQAERERLTGAFRSLAAADDETQAVGVAEPARAAAPAALYK